MEKSFPGGEEKKQFFRKGGKMNGCRRKILKCSVCGLTVETFGGEVPSTPVCCGKPMEEMKPKKEEEGKEKHIPFAERTSDGHLLVKVGEKAEHPMTEAHHIVWIQYCCDGRSGRIWLDPSDKPCATFSIKPEKGMKLMEYCNIHGLWEGEIK